MILLNLFFLIFRNSIKLDIKSTKQFVEMCLIFFSIEEQLIIHLIVFIYNLFNYKKTKISQLNCMSICYNLLLQTHFPIHIKILVNI